MAQLVDTVEGTPRYTIRFSEPADKDGIIDLYNCTFGDGSKEWFEWKYGENPATEHVPIIVATYQGEVVGARPCVPFRMRVGNRTVGAIRFGDTMVDADHRRRGLFTRMTQRMMKYYAALEPAFGFNHPNELSLPGYQTLGGRVVGQFSIAYRIQNPAALLGERANGPVAHGVSMTAPLAQAYLKGRERFTPPIESDITVTRHHTPPAETLAALYEEGPPEGIHAERTSRFYEWRFRNPQWEYATYVASRDEPVAAVIAGTQQSGDKIVTTLAEAVPMTGAEERKAAFATLVRRILEDNEDVDLLAYSGRVIPESVLHAVGFHQDTKPPLSWLASENRLVAHELGGEVCTDWRVNGVNLLEPSNWSLSFCEQDAR